MIRSKLGLLFLLVALAAMLGTSSGCSYGGISTTDEGLVVVPVNNVFLFGALRSVYVCKVTPKGLAECSERETP